MVKKFILIILFISAIGTESYSQKLEYLNKYWYPVQDTSIYDIFYHRITIEDSLRKSVRIIYLDSMVSYQRIEIKEKKRQPFTKTEVWYNDSGNKTMSRSFSSKKEMEETIKYFDSGRIKSKVVKSNGKVIEESYFSESGQKIEPPLFISALPNGGLQSWTEYLRTNLVYPPAARYSGQEGTVYLHFYVNEKGEMEEIEIMNPEENHPTLNREALRVIMSYPYLWTPSYEDGIAKKSEMRLPINFKLTD
jgi:TonB family protein